MSFTAIVAATVAHAAAAHAQRNRQSGVQVIYGYKPCSQFEAPPAREVPKCEPTAKVMKDLRADAWSEQNTAYLAKCATALLFVVAVWIGVVLWSSSKSPEPVPSTQPEQSN